MTAARGNALPRRLAAGFTLAAAIVVVGFLGTLARAEGYSAGPLALVLTAIVTPLAARELARLLRAVGLRAGATTMTVAVWLGLIACAPEAVGLPPAPWLSVGLIVLAGVVAGAPGFAQKRPIESLTGAIAGVFGCVYLGVLFGFVVRIAHEYTPWHAVAAVLIVKSFDIGAYAVGSTLGRHKFIPWLSPGKTWEGLVGGAATSAALGAVASIWLPEPNLPLPGAAAGAVAGVLVGLAGQAGDLSESLIKRAAAEKDAGRSVPGFGGLLDVVDSLLLGLPAAYLALAVWS